MAAAHELHMVEEPTVHIAHLFLGHRRRWLLHWEKDSHTLGSVAWHLMLHNLLHIVRHMTRCHSSIFTQVLHLKMHHLPSWVWYL